MTFSAPGPDAEEARRKDYSLVGRDTALAIERGLAEADWYTSPVPREAMRELLERRDGPAIRDTLLYVALLLATGYATWRLWGSWWALLPMMAYGVLYASASDSRWHEAGHGTAFRTDWMNAALYEVASFMVLRESVPWRWSHTRHHSDTIIVGRDPEIAVPRPPDLREMFLKCFNYRAWRRYFTNSTLHAFGRITAIEATFIPPAEYPKVFLRARIYLAIMVAVAGACVYWRTWLPLVFVYGPNLYGAWLMAIYGWTQHAALAENVLDHRLNCRTIHMNPVHRFLYWNMNYHTEHHMFPMVPYHQLPKLHALVKDDCPEPYPSLTAAYREMIPALLRQIREPGWYVRRALPPTARPVGTRPTMPAITTDGRPIVDGWVEVCASAALGREDAVRVDHAHRTFAVFRAADGTVYATDGMCTHGNTHLADGLVRGAVVECPKHNGRFDVASGAPVRVPACIALRTHEAKEEGGRVWLRVGGGATADTTPVYTFRVVSNRNVATFIK
ncbi:fatty acid desaturase, partial [Luteitalea sp.]|uniref:fatty acid desaturase n=1 Tax=Luteitalea sp. TaxID=2004800 RepID=UPI0037CB0F5C